ncbi:LASP1 [Cordylochernes scorpioides]|uniref:LASP1 n=1 Tax=Cordylochernes scorpioides TaxID=51811 RepID=A0ABY6K0L4_9ARAC|nr:LASP1 [Cordylochernes scorpioides]
MTLNMKTYKGFNKLPYCNAPAAQVKYHEDFEKQKGKVTQVADDPETLRIRNTTKIISNVSYHGELDKKKEMEMKRQLVPEKNGATEPAANLSAPEPRSLDQPPHIAKDSPYSSKLSSTVIFTSQDGAATIEAPPAVMPQQNYKPPQPTGLSFCAMYDYTAQDVDEVSFHEGDVIINCKPIDDGWMMGTVQRSGQEGMLPANYVAPIN